MADEQKPNWNLALWGLLGILTVQSVIAVGTHEPSKAFVRRRFRKSLQGLDGVIPQNVLCFFELFEGQNENASTAWGSPIPGSCDRKAGGSVSTKRREIKRFVGQKGDPEVACKFPVYARYKGVALGVARNCRKTG